MSTRCMLHFQEKFNGTWVDQAIIYRHTDGYPEGKYGVKSDLRKFFKEIKDNVNDNRFDNAECLAARFVVWQSRKLVRDYNGKKKYYLDFLGIGCSLKDHGDIEYSYFIRAITYGKHQRKTPQVICKNI